MLCLCVIFLFSCSLFLLSDFISPPSPQGMCKPIRCGSGNPRNWGDCCVSFLLDSLLSFSFCDSPPSVIANFCFAL